MHADDDHHLVEVGGAGEEDEGRHNKCQHERNGPVNQTKSWVGWHWQECAKDTRYERNIDINAH